MPQHWKGTMGDDNFIGVSISNIFNMRQGGHDTCTGGYSNDTFRMGHALDAGDHLVGFDYDDRVWLHGDYSAGLVLGATTLSGIGTLRLNGAFDYNLTTDDGTVDAGQWLNVTANDVTGGHSLTFDGAAETNGHFLFHGSAGGDDLTGGARRDIFRLASGGGDTANGGGGKDLFSLGTVSTDTVHIHGGNGDDVIRIGTNIQNVDVGTQDPKTSDTFDGGTGNDTLHLAGDMGNQAQITPFVFTAGSLTSIETLLCDGGHDYLLHVNDGVLGAGETLTVDGSALGSSDVMRFEGNDVTNAAFIVDCGNANAGVHGGALADTIIGGAGSNQITGNGGGDDITCGADGDNLRYQTVSDSTSTAHDIVHGFDAGNDLFEVSVAVASFYATPIDHSVSAATFDSDIAAAGDDALHHNAWIVHANLGDLSGHDFLVIDTNGNALYNAGTDYVIDITGYTGTLTTGNFH